MRILPAVAALAAFATAAIAQPGGDAGGPNGNQSGTAKTNEKGERLICRWVHDADVGSLVQGRTRRCLTAEQWRAMPRR